MNHDPHHCIEIVITRPLRIELRVSETELNSVSLKDISEIEGVQRSA